MAKFVLFGEQKPDRVESKNNSFWFDLRSFFLLLVDQTCFFSLILRPQVEDLDQEGRCLMVELVSGLVIFNVYAPFLKNEATETTEARKATENLKTPESTESIEEKHRRRESSKLKFLQLLQRRVEKTQREGKMAIVCGDLNLTWRTADVHENGLYVKVIENCIAENPAWSLSAKGAFLADLSKSMMQPPCPRACNPSKLLYKSTQTQDGKEIHWIRVGDALKELEFDVVLPWAEAMELLKVVDADAEAAEATDASFPRAWCGQLWSLRSLLVLRDVGNTTDTQQLWPSDAEPITPKEALQGAAERPVGQGSEICRTRAMCKTIRIFFFPLRQSASYERLSLHWVAPN